MEEYKDKFVPESIGITMHELRDHSTVHCNVIDLCECDELECNACVYDTLSNTIDYLFYKGYIDKAGAMELTLSGIHKD